MSEDRQRKTVDEIVDDLESNGFSHFTVYDLPPEMVDSYLKNHKFDRNGNSNYNKKIIYSFGDHVAPALSELKHEIVKDIVKKSAKRSSESKDLPEMIVSYVKKMNRSVSIDEIHKKFRKKHKIQDINSATLESMMVGYLKLGDKCDIVYGKCPSL